MSEIIISPVLSKCKQIERKRACFGGAGVCTVNTVFTQATIAELVENKQSSCFNDFRFKWGFLGSVQRRGRKA